MKRSEEELAREYRRRLGVDHLPWFDPLTILMKLKRQLPGSNYSVVAPDEIAPPLAKWDSSRKLILIGDDTIAAANGPRADGRARFSVFHEVMHALGGHEGELNRVHSRSDIPQYAVKLRALESRTDKTAAAFVAPRHLISERWAAPEVAFRFGMSLESARFRIEEIRGERGLPGGGRIIWRSCFSI